MPNEKKLPEALMQAAFKAGWAAAHLSLATIADEEGQQGVAEWMRNRANEPDNVVITDATDAEPKS